MTENEKHSIREVIDEIADIKTLLYLGMMACDALDAEDSNALNKNFSLAWNSAGDASKLLYRILGQEPPKGAGNG